MTPDMIVGIYIGAALMGLLIAVLYLWMPRKVERHIVGPCVMPGRVCMMHRNDRYVQDKRITETVSININGGPRNLSPEQVASLIKELNDRTGVR